MAVRTGMGNLLLQLRGMCDVSATDYLVNGVQFWTDQQLQDILDSYVTPLEQIDDSPFQLQPIAEYAGGATIFKDYPIGWGNLEEQISGSPYWVLVDSTGLEVSNTLYDADYIIGNVRFKSNTNGAIYFLSHARSYAMERAAAEVWRQKMGHTARMVDFRSDGQSFTRSQWFANCKGMMDFYQRQGGVSTTRLTRSDLA